MTDSKHINWNEIYEAAYKSDAVNEIFSSKFSEIKDMLLLSTTGEWIIDPSDLGEIDQLILKEVIELVPLSVKNLENLVRGIKDPAQRMRMCLAIYDFARACRIMGDYFPPRDYVQKNIERKQGKSENDRLNGVRIEKTEIKNQKLQNAITAVIGDRNPKKITGDEIIEIRVQTMRAMGVSEAVIKGPVKQWGWPSPSTVLRKLKK